MPATYDKNSLHLSSDSIEVIIADHPRRRWSYLFIGNLMVVDGLKQQGQRIWVAIQYIQYVSALAWIALWYLSTAAGHTVARRVRARIADTPLNRIKNRDRFESFLWGLLGYVLVWALILLFVFPRVLGLHFNF